MTLTRIQIPCSNYSSGLRPRLIVLHTTEGAQTYQSLGNFFVNSTNSPNPVSSHVGIDDTPNTVGEYVQRPNMAWTASAANSVAIQAELCTPSGAASNWTLADWDRHPTMLANTAAWIAEEAAHFAIPIVKLTPSEAQSNGRGVCQHSDLGSWGGGHHDCGPAFPVDRVIAMASGKPTPLTPTPPPTTLPPTLHVDYFGVSHNSTVPDVRVWQSQMSHRGWTITADQIYGPQSQNVCEQFQFEKGLAVDGLVGPQTWNATWTAPIT